MHNLSTIEFCEKHFRRSPGQNIYNRGCCGNLGDVFGHHPLLWFLPVGMAIFINESFSKLIGISELFFSTDNRPGDGVHFQVNQEAMDLLQRGLSSRHNRSEQSQESVKYES